LTDDAISLIATLERWMINITPRQQRPAEITISRMLTNALMSKYGWADPKVHDCARHAYELVETINDAKLVVPSLWNLVVYHHVASHRVTVRSLTDQLLYISSRSHDRNLRAASKTLSGIAAWIDGRHAQAVIALDQALAEFDSESDSHTQYVQEVGLDSKVWAMAAKGCVQWFSNPNDEYVFGLAQKAVAYARHINHIPSLGVALMYLAFNYQWSNNLVLGLAVADEMLALAKKYDLPAIEAYGAIIHSWATSNLSVADQVLAGLQSLGCMLGFTCANAMTAEIAARAGDYSAALVRIEKSVLLANESGELYYQPELLIRRALYRAKTRIDAESLALSYADLQLALQIAEAAGKRRSAQNACLAQQELRLIELSIQR